MSNTIKAKRTQIDLGGVALPIYQLPDGSYRLSGQNICDAVKEHPETFSRFLDSEHPKALSAEDSTSSRLIQPPKGRPFSSVPISVAYRFWVKLVAKENQLATALVLACGEETIERRADRAFGVKRTEEEYDQRLASRVKRVAARLAWTDIIKRDQERRGVYLTELGTREFSQLTRLVNRRLFGVEHFNCDRDNMTQDQELDIIAFERMLLRRFNPSNCDLVALISDCLDYYQSVCH